MNTIEAAQRKKEEEERRLARAQKFGLTTAESQEQKKMMRAVKFGLAAPENQQVKIRTVISTGKLAEDKSLSKFEKKA